jgi:phage anti-repressor protein
MNIQNEKKIETEQGLSPKQRTKVIKELNQSPLLHFSEQIKNDKEICEYAVKHEPSNFYYVPNHLKSKEMCEFIVNQENVSVFVNHIPKEMIDKEMAMTLLRNEYVLINELNPELQNDKEVVIQAVGQSGGYQFEFVLDKFKNDKDVCLLAVREDFTTYKFISDELKNDLNFNLDAVKESGYVFSVLKPDFQNNEQMVLNAVSEENNRDYIFDEYVSKDLKMEFGYEQEEFIKNLENYIFNEQQDAYMACNSSTEEFKQYTKEKYNIDIDV